MAGTLEEYKRLFREAHVSDQMKLFRLHIAIYLVVNAIWLALNMMGSIKIEPAWAMYYSPVGVNAGIKLSNYSDIKLSSST